MIAIPLNSSIHTWMHSPKSRCTAAVVLDPIDFSVDLQRTFCFPFPTLQEELWVAQYLNYSHETWETKVWLLSYQRFPFCPGTQEKHPVSQTNGGTLLKLKRAKLRSQNPVTVNGDQVPAFHSDFLLFPCLEMVPKEICSVTFMETKVKLTSVKFS